MPARPDISVENVILAVLVVAAVAVTAVMGWLSRRESSRNPERTAPTLGAADAASEGPLKAALTRRQDAGRIAGVRPA